MADAYQAYIERLKGQARENPYQRSIAQRMSSYRGGNDPESIIAKRMSMQGYSAGAVASAVSNVEQSRQARRTEMFQQAEAQDIQRRDDINNRVSEIEFQREQYEEQQAKQREAKRKQWWQVGGQVAGAGLGAVAGAFAGNPLMGAQIGAGLGGGIAGAITGSPEAVMANVQSTLSGMSSGFKDKNVKKSTDAIMNAYNSNPDIFNNMTDAQLNILTQNAGNPEFVSNFLSAIGSNQANNIAMQGMSGGLSSEQFRRMANSIVFPN